MKINREIKFRVWDTFDKRFLSLKDYQDLGAIEVENDGTLTLSPRFRFLTSMRIMPERFVPLQYTGLKDKNRKEIYEGDILRNYGHDVEDWVISYDCGRFIGTFDGVCEDLYEISDFEVVGNIYELKDSEIK